MAAPTRTAIQIERDRAEIARRYVQGETQAAIAEGLGVSQQQVSYDLKRIQEAWLASSLRDFDTARAHEVAKIDLMEREYFLAWEASKLEFQSSVTEIITTTTTKGPPQSPPVNDPKRSKAQIKKEDRIGDPRYLAGVMSCIERRCKLLGLDAPTKASNQNWDMSTFSDDELRRIIAGADPGAVFAERRP